VRAIILPAVVAVARTLERRSPAPAYWSESAYWSGAVCSLVAVYWLAEAYSSAAPACSSAALVYSSVALAYWSAAPGSASVVPECSLAAPAYSSAVPVCLSAGSAWLLAAQV
jgi:hypothetical protein